MKKLLLVLGFVGIALLMSCAPAKKLTLNNVADVKKMEYHADGVLWCTWCSQCGWYSPCGTRVWPCPSCGSSMMFITVCAYVIE